MENALPIALQDRDLGLLRTLFESRVMTLEHAAKLHFDGRQEAAKKRIQKLKAADIIGERPRRTFAPSVLFLITKAFRLLSEAGVLAEYPPLPVTTLEKRAHVSDLTVRHELAVMDVKVAIACAILALEPFTLIEFSTWPLLNQFRATRPRTRAEVVVKPDGHLRVHERSDGSVFEHTFFLEVDRSTETQETLALKATCYADYYRSGGLAARHGQPRSAYKDFPFRVLMVFNNTERRNNAAERMLQNSPPVLTQVWLTTFDEITTDPLGSIWMRPVDYRDITKGTAFDTERPRTDWAYRRQPTREVLVEVNIRKHRLLQAGEQAADERAPASQAS